MAGVIYSPAGPVNTKYPGPGFKVAVGLKWPHEGKILWKCQKQHSKSPFTLQLVFYFLSFCLFVMLVCSFAWLHCPGSQLQSPGSLPLVAPWGILDVACGTQSLDQGGF